MTNPCLILNDRSGSALRYRPTLQQLATDAGVPVLSAGQEPQLESVLPEYDRWIVAGGDGTLARIVNLPAARDPGRVLALIPTGTGNDLARSLGIPGGSLKQAWDLALTNPSTTIDLLKVTNGTTRYVANAATAGFGGAVSTDVTREDKQRWGAIAYWMTAFSHLATLDQYHVRLELDDEEVELRTYGLVISNGQFVGGGFAAAPSAIVNDGMLDITTVPVLGGLELLAAGLDFTLGRHHLDERVRTYRSRQVRIHAEPTLPYSLDGEPSHGIDATFEVVPDALRIVCGPEAPAVRAVEEDRMSA